MIGKSQKIKAEQKLCTSSPNTEQQQRATASKQQAETAKTSPYSRSKKAPFILYL